MPSVAAVVARARREEVYHRRHADALVVRMLGDRDGGERVAAAITRLLPFADAVWDPVDGEPAAVADGIVAASSGELQRRWRVTVEATIGAIDWSALERPDQRARTRRSEHFAALHARITEVIALDPAARW